MTTEVQTTSDESTRLQCVQELSRVDSTDRLPRLISALNDESWRVRREAVAALLALRGSESIGSVLRAMRDHVADLGAHNSAMQVLSQAGVDTLGPLAEFLGDKDPELRVCAALTMGNQNNPRAVPALLRALADPDLNVRYHAIEALGKLKSCEAVDSLVKLAQTRDFTLAFPALDALASIGDPRAAFPLATLLDDETLRIPTIEALGHLGGDEAVAPLLKQLHEHRSLAAAIATALTRMHERHETRYGRGDLIENVVRHTITSTGATSLVEAAADANGPELNAIAHVLGWMEAIEVDRPLSQLLVRSESRTATADALVRRGARVTDLMIEQLRNDDDEVRKAAVVTLGRIGDAKAIPSLLEILNDDPESIVAAAGALAMIGDHQAYEPLLGLLGDENATVRRAAVSALNSLAHPQMAADMERCLGDADPRVRESAVSVVGYAGFPSCIAAMFECCRDENEQVRRAALEALSALEDCRIPSMLTEGLADAVAGVRAAAARALGQVDNFDVWPLLERAIADKTSWVRYYAVRSAARRGISASVETLNRLAQLDPAMQVRVAAVEALGQFADSSSVPLLAALSQSPDADLARAAVSALGATRRLDALPPLSAALETPDAVRRIDVLRAVEASGHAEAVADLHRVATSDRDAVVAKTAVEALGGIAAQEAIDALISLTALPTLRADCVTALSCLAEGNEAFIGRGLSDPQPDVRLAVVDARRRDPDQRERRSS